MNLNLEIQSGTCILARSQAYLLVDQYWFSTKVHLQQLGAGLMVQTGGELSRAVSAFRVTARAPKKGEKVVWPLAGFTPSLRCSGKETPRSLCALWALLSPPPAHTHTHLVNNPWHSFLLDSGLPGLSVTFYDLWWVYSFARHLASSLALCVLSFSILRSTEKSKSWDLSFLFITFLLSVLFILHTVSITKFL